MGLAVVLSKAGGLAYLASAAHKLRLTYLLHLTHVLLPPAAGGMFWRRRCKGDGWTASVMRRWVGRAGRGSVNQQPCILRFRAVAAHACPFCPCCYCSGSLMYVVTCMVFRFLPVLPTHAAYQC